MPSSNGAGVFARRLVRRMPTIPVEEEGRLTDPALRENFITGTYVYHRGQRSLIAKRLVEFHARRKMLIRAHGEFGYQRLGRLVADGETRDIAELVEECPGVLMKSIKRPATREQHSDVLSHLARYLKRDIDAGDKAELVRVIKEKIK
jgi:uncharacterized protein YbgA (DUF1722 family)